MKVIDLRQSLELHRQLLAQLGAKQADVADLEKFISLLLEFDELSISALCAKFTERKVEIKTASKPKFDEDVVTRYIERFAAPGADRMRQLMIIEQLKIDKSAKAAETSAIVDGITKSGVKYSKKPEAIKALESWYNRAFDTEHRLQGTSGIF